VDKPEASKRVSAGMKRYWAKRTGAVSAFVVQPDSHVDQPEVRVHASHGSIARAWMEQNGFRKLRAIQSAESAGSLFG
jgi:hypothetical protein